MKAVSVCLCLLGLVAALAFAPYPDGPPLGHTGGFGEPTCQACHAGDSLNTPGGSLALDLPARYEPGQTYDIAVRLSRAELKRAGFELSLRYADGTQAGLLDSPTPERIRTGRFREITYGFHKRPGTAVAGDTAHWTLRWTAPDRRDSVLVHVASVAANDDNSNLGDLVYATSAVLRPR